MVAERQGPLEVEGRRPTQERGQEGLAAGQHRHRARRLPARRGREGDQLGGGGAEFLVGG